jgi:putative hydrolase of the HAD superfamily
MIKAVIFDWGNTLMVDFYDQKGAMHTWKNLKTTKNAKECLEIVSKKFPCFLGTNADDSNKDDIYKALKIVGIDKYITDIFCSKEIGFHKPSKEFFYEILNKLNVNPEEIVFIGDDLDKDIKCAKKVGIIPILYDPCGLSNYEGLKVNDLKNLINLLKILS